MVHGLDHFVTGTGIALTGISRKPFTERFFQNIGMSSTVAYYADLIVGLAPIRAARIFSSSSCFLNTCATKEGLLENTVNQSRSIWTSTKKETSVQNAYNHWTKHGKEFPELYNSKQYVDHARKFYQNPGVLTKRRANGEYVCYHPDANIFGTYTKDWIPKTMYKPDPMKHRYPTNLEYFYAQ